MNEDSYKKTFCIDYQYQTPKERKLKYLSILTGKKIRYWKNLKKNQLNAIIKQNEKNNNRNILQGF